MTRATSIRAFFVVLVATVGLLFASLARAQLSFEPTWQLPTYGDVRAQVFEWIDLANANAEIKQEARTLWPSLPLRELSGSELLDLLVETAAVMDGPTAQLVEACNAELQGPFPPDANWIDDSSLPKFVKNNLHLYMARWLSQQTMYDAALDSLAHLETIDVVDPATLLFHKMIAYHQVVEPDLSRAALVELLEHEDQLPQRYRQVAEMIEQDLAGLKDESLDHVSRRMNDVRRRLELGQAGKTVQVVEKGVVDSLDKMIKQLEEQQQQQQSFAPAGSSQGSPQQGGQLLPSLPPGKINPRDVGHQSGWGDLPPKEREEAMQQIGREYPAHYRQLIEQYFRDLADQSPKSSEK
jgi:hypothetical protein